MKDKWINIRCTEQERQGITEQAKEYNMSVASYIRYLVAKGRNEMKEILFRGKTPGQDEHLENDNVIELKEVGKI